MSSSSPFGREAERVVPNTLGSGPRNALLNRRCLDVPLDPEDFAAVIPLWAAPRNSESIFRLLPFAPPHPWALASIVPFAEAGAECSGQLHFENI